MKLRDGAVSWREVEGDIVLLDERTWKYVHLNGTASLLFRALAEGEPSEDDLVATITGAYPEVDASQAANDVAGFLSALRGRDYLVD